MSKQPSNKGRSLEGKTVRPGLLVYSFYHSDRHSEHVATPAPVAARVKPKAAATPQAHKSYLQRSLVAAAIIIGLFVLVPKTHRVVFGANEVDGKGNATATAALPATSACTGNTLGKFIVVSVSQRHLWACQGFKKVYESAVVTGYQGDPADATPLGSYSIFTKETGVQLTGSDNKGSWDDPVSYWMPFLFNQYGTYGFHDATWRAPGDFGNVSPNSASASHGCVELPLASAKWLYNWSAVGTTLKIEA